MVKQALTAKELPDKKNGRKTERSAQPEQANEYAGAIEPANWMLGTNGDGMINRLGAHMADPRLPINHRRAIVSQFGRLQGNLAVQRTLQRTPNKMGMEAQSIDGSTNNQRGLRILETIKTPSVQLDPADDATQMSITPAYAERLVDLDLEEQINRVRNQTSGPGISEDLRAAAQANLSILEFEVDRRTNLAQQTMMTTLNILSQQESFDPNSSTFNDYCESYETVSLFCESAPQEPQGIQVPAGQLLVVDEQGQVLLLNDENIVEIGDDLLQALDGVVNESQTGQWPDIGLGPMGQVLLWEDGRAVITPPVTADLPTLLSEGEPTVYEAGFGLENLESNWQQVNNPAVFGLLHSGIYQLGTFPISSFQGINLPPGARIRFADPFFPLSKQTRMLTIFQKGTNRFYSWDFHATPPGAKPHPLWHVNQQGMAGLFGQTNRSPLTPSQIVQARNLRYINIGGRVFLVIGVLSDSYSLTSSVIESIEQGTPRPAIAQTVRVVSGWGGAWAGAKLFCGGGTVALSETGPGALLGCIGGGFLGGVIGFFAGDWIASLIE